MNSFLQFKYKNNRRILSKRALLFAGTLLLTSCFHNTEDSNSVDPGVQYPALTAAAEFESLQQLEPLALDLENSPDLLSNILKRIMNVVEIANQEADEVAENQFRPAPLFKPAPRRLNIVTAQNNRCDNASNSSGNTESLVWGDNDESGNPSLGDDWFYILEGCENAANLSVVTGVIQFSGMEDFDELGAGAGNEFENYQYNFDIQIESATADIVYLKDVRFTYSRALVAGEEVTSLSIADGSKFGIKVGNNRYLLVINSAMFESNDDLATLKVSLSGKYHESSSFYNGQVELLTEEPLVFRYTRHNFLQTPFESINMTSGILKMFGNDSDVAILMVNDADDTKLSIGVEASETDTIEKNQSDIFDVNSFSLVNLTG